MRIEVKQLRCRRCLHTWAPRKPEVRVCPKCHSPYWDRNRDNAEKKGQAKILLEKIVGRIIKAFHPEKIILFGSHVRGTAGPNSDVDLMVVAPVRGSRRRKATEIDAALVGIPMSIDLIVVTPQQIRQGSSRLMGIVRTAFLEGKTLYEKAA